MTHSSNNQITLLGEKNPWLWRALLVLLLVMGAALRLIDITDPPLDFHPTRQLRNSIVARSIYYEMLPDADPHLRKLALEFRQRVGVFEPPIIETLVAWTYTWTGGENIAVARVYETLFWLLAGLALFDLARRIASKEAALVALAYYLVLPFSVQASRSFQPDPMMASAFVIGLYFLVRWTEEQNWKWAVLAGLFGGFATLTKIVIAFLVGSAAIAAVLSVYGWRKFWKIPQVWGMAIIMILPAFSFYILRGGERSNEYFISATVEMFQLLSTTKFYAQWLGFLHSIFGLSIIFISLAGIFIATVRVRAILLSLWVGYFVYGLTLPFVMYTHTYYHIQLIPIIALGLALVADAVFRRMGKLEPFWKVAYTAMLIFTLAYPAWIARSVLIAEDFRGEPAHWEQIASVIPPESDTIALTHDYGYRLMYYGWLNPKLWPILAQPSELRGGKRAFYEKFDAIIEGKEFFIVTNFRQLQLQQELSEILYENYPLLVDQDDYLIFDLRTKKQPAE